MVNRIGPRLTACLLVLAVGYLEAAAAQPPTEAEQHYERFLTVYRNSAATSQDLRRAAEELKEANRLAPDVYKYRFSLGAINHSLGVYAEALTWFDRAYELADSPERRESIELARQQCRAEMIRAEVARVAANVESPSLQITFIMKGGTLELEQGALDRLPHKLPVVAAAEPGQPLVAALSQAGAAAGGRTGAAIHGVDLNGLVIAGWVPETQLVDAYERGFKDHLAFLRQRYFPEPPQRKLVIVLSEYVEQLALATKSLYPEAQLPVYAPFMGYYNPADHLIMATSGRAGYGTLLHELMHASLREAFPDAPGWFNEGFASLYERTRWVDRKLEPLPNWRMDALLGGSVSSLEEIAAGTAEPRPSPRQMAELRLLFLYVDSTRGMDELYGLIRSGKSLAAALAQLDLHEPGWREFVADTVSKYRAELSADRGALSNPDDVRFVQRALNLSLGSNLTVDGVWGGATGEKLVEFQRAHGLQPDGIIGAQTMRELKRQFALETLE